MYSDLIEFFTYTILFLGLSTIIIFIRLIGGLLIHEILKQRSVWRNWKIHFQFSVVTQLWIARVPAQR